MAVPKVTPVATVRAPIFPGAGDTVDVFTLTTGVGTGYVDLGTGVMLDWQASGPWTVVDEWIYLLHGGDGVALGGRSLAFRR